MPKTNSKKVKTSLVKAKSHQSVLNEKDEYEKAIAQTDLNEKVKALQKFLDDFPKTTKKNEALEIISSIRAVMADEKLKIGELADGIRLFREAVEEAPDPVPEGLFANVLLQIPNKLFFLGHQNESLTIANLIESKIKNDPKHLLGLATFYLSIENAENARMLAQSAIDLDGTMPAAFQTLGLAYRLKFELEESENAYAKALELDPESAVSKRSLAETKRAVRKPEDAAALYRELLEKDADDVTAQNGLILSLFDLDRRDEAEELLNKSLAGNPNNLFLLVGAAYWYAAQQDGVKAVDLAQKAVDIAPRYVWARIALARGQMLQKLPFEAEKTLLLAQKYGNFPTLDYELATARFQAGLFEEAARELKKRFAVRDGYIQTYIAGRIIKEAESFTELLSLERRASIFITSSADAADDAQKLKSLLDLNLKLENKDVGDDELNQSVDEFVGGDDKMKAHRQLYAASRLLDEKRSLAKALDLTQGAIKGVDSSLEVLNPSAAVLADELIESRSIAISKDEVVVMPDVPAQTLSRIMRGKIEELAGWTLYQQDKPQEAVVRLKRAVSILPEKSTWWRSSNWRLGLALDAAGNSKESLDILVKIYLDGEPDRFRRGVIEGVYRKVNGNVDELDKLIGVNPFSDMVAQVVETPSPTPTPDAGISPTPAEGSQTPEAVPTGDPTPEVKNDESPTPTPEESPKTESTPVTVPETTVTPTPETSPVPDPTVSPSPAREEDRENNESSKVQATPVSSAPQTPAVENSPTPGATPAPAGEPTPTPVISPTPKSETVVEPSMTPAPVPEVESTPVPKVETSPTPKTLFDPVVIQVGKNEATPSPAVTRDKEPVAVENTAEPSSETVAKNTEARPIDPISRPRIVRESSPETLSCLIASQESLSILANGGNLGILVGMVDEGDPALISAEASSSEDITVSLEPGIGRQSNRAFYVIRSISTNKGVFTVTFNSPCGKKEIQVKVR